MDTRHSFKFVGDEWNRRLLALLRKAKIKHEVDRAGLIHYSRADEEIVGNELISSLRKRIFPRWQVLSCPKDWTDRYRRYMIRRRIEFREEWINRHLCFLLPRKHRPHSWNLQEPGHPLKPHCDTAAVNRLCVLLGKDRRAGRLGEDIARDLQTGAISESVFNRLSRWCNPVRSEPYAQPIAQKISEELFGHVLRRVA